MYPGLKCELEQTILSPKFNITRQEEATPRMIAVSYSIRRDTKLVAYLTKTTSYQGQQTEDSEFGNGFKMFGTNFYSINVADALFVANKDDKGDFSELFNLCDARYNFEKDQKNVAALQFLAKQRQK